LFGRTCTTCGGLGHTVHLPGEIEPEIGEISAERVVLTNNRIVASPVSSETPERPSLRPAIPAYEQVGIREEPEVVEFDASNNFQELELLNHPSYQDIGTSNARRRRRRIRDMDSLTRDEETPRTSIRMSPTVQYGAESRSDMGFSEGFSGRSGFSERSRPTKSDIIKPPVEPPEVISVEMTPEEQEVYALMGISPLMLSHQQVKNPRSVIVTVRSPGEEPVSPASLMDEDSDESETLAISIGVSERPLSERIIPERIISERPLSERIIPERIISERPLSERIILERETPEVEEPDPKPEFLLPEIESVELPEEESSDSDHEPGEPIIRRRRRRSSAVSE
jgi:ribonuclease E